jgi:hypothetical protein
MLYGKNMAKLHKPKLIMVFVRVVLVTFILTLLAFAVSLLAAIAGFAIYSHFTGKALSMAMAYRMIAAPAALAVAGVVFVLSLALEIKHYRQNKALATMEE